MSIDLTKPIEVACSEMMGSRSFVIMNLGHLMLELDIMSPQEHAESKAAGEAYRRLFESAPELYLIAQQFRVGIKDPMEPMEFLARISKLLSYIETGHKSEIYAQIDQDASGMKVN